MRVYKVVKLRTEGKYLVTVTITTADAAAKVIESVKAKAEYQEIYFNIVETPKSNKECRKMLKRPVLPQTDTTREDPISNIISNILYDPISNIL